MSSPIPTTLSDLVATLASLSPFLSQLSSVLTSSSPPTAIFVHAPANQHLVLPLIQLIINQSTPVPSTSAARPSVQELLPKQAVIDLTEVHSTRAAFDRALNTFAGWLAEDQLGTGWSEADRVVPNWDGRVEGCSVVRRGNRGAVAVAGGKADGGRRPQKRQKKSPSKPSEVDDDQVVIPDSDQDDTTHSPTKAQDGSGWAISWDRSTGAVDKDPVGPIRDTLDYFYLSLGKINNLGRDGKSTAEGTRRWLIFDHAEMLHDLPAAGNAGGAPKETGLGMTFASGMYRVGQLSGTPTSTIAISKLSWTKAREGMVGLASPTLIDFPPLSGIDTINLLGFRFAQTNPTSDIMDQPTLIELFNELATVVWNTFSSALPELDELAYLCAKFWPTWSAVVGNSNPPIAPDDIARLSAHIKPEFTKELDRLAQPRMTLSASVVQGEGGSSVVLQGFTGSIPTGPAQPAAEGSNSALHPSIIQPSPSSSHTLPLTPIKKRALRITDAAAAAANNGNAHLVASPRKALSIASDVSLSRSLPTLAKWLLLASFYAAFNPPKTDVRCFVRVDDGIARKGKRHRRPVAKRPGVDTKAQLRPELGGGKAFPLERLLAIFEAVVEDEFVGASRGDALMQVTTLVGLRLLQRVSAGDRVVEGVKLKCKVNRETVDALARSLGKPDWAQSLYNVED